MTAGPPRHPSNWRLWNPNQGISFQQPLHPNLETTRFFTEASPAETRHDAPDVSLPVRSATTHAPEDEPVSEALDEDGLTGLESTLEETKIIAATNSEDAEFEESKEITIDVPPPFTPLEFSIPEEAFRLAKAAPFGSGESFWSHTLYRGAQDVDEEVQIERHVGVHYCSNSKDAEEALQHLVAEKILGLDLEWAPHANKNWGPRKNVSLIQLASSSTVVLLHIALYPKGDIFASPTLKKILNDPNIRKTGVWIKGDCLRLQTYMGIDVRGQFELSHLYNQVTHLSNGAPELINKRLVSLATQVKEITGLPLRKGNDVRTSDWSKPLKAKQIMYSASDAYAGVQLFAMLNHKRQELDPTPPLPFHAELDRPIPLPHGLESPSSTEQTIEGEATEEVTIHEEHFSYQMGSNGQSFAAEATTTKVKVKSSTPRARRVTDNTTPKAPKGSSTKPTKSTAKTRGPVDPADPRIVTAEQEYVEYKASRPADWYNPGAARLRAYFMWHANEDLNPEGLGQVLRVRPATVANYILDSVAKEKLPYDKHRMKTEVFKELEPHIIWRRHAKIWNQVKHIATPSPTSTGG